MAWYDALTGLLKSAVQGPIGQNIVGGALGAATQGDPYTIERYWGGIERQRQHKQLEALAHNLGVIQPGQALPPGIETPQDLGMLTPQRKYTKGGYWEERIGQPPVFVPGGPPEQPKVHGTQAQLGEMQAVFYAQHGREPQTAEDFESVRDIADANLERKKLAYDQARAQSPEKVPKPHWDPKLGWMYPPSEPGAPAPPPVTPPGFTGQTTKDPLNMSLEGLRTKGMTFRDPVTGVQFRSEGKIKTGVDAVNAGAVAFNKEDETLFTNRQTVADMAKQMLELMPQLTQRDQEIMRSRARTQPILIAGTNQLIQQWEVPIQASDSPKLKKYVGLLNKIQVSKMRELFPTGRLPVYDQQLFMGKDISPRDNLEVQKAQLGDMRQSAITQMKKMLKPTTTSPFGEETPEPSVAPPRIGEVQDGHIYIGGDPGDPNSWTPLPARAH